MWQGLVRPGLGFTRILFIDRDRTVQIARAIENMFCTVRVRDFLTKPHYYLVANRNVGRGGRVWGSVAHYLYILLCIYLSIKSKWMSEWDGLWWWQTRLSPYYVCMEQRIHSLWLYPMESSAQMKILLRPIPLFWIDLKIDQLTWLIAWFFMKLSSILLIASGKAFHGLKYWHLLCNCC